jgi:hypothetical protein
MNADGAPAPAADTGTAPVAGATTEPGPAPAKHVGGIGLGLSAVWALIRNFFRRLFGGGKTT